MRRVRSLRPSPAMVVACAALFVALGGTGLAATYVVSSNSQIGPGTVSGHTPPTGKHANIIAGSVNGTDLATGAVTQPKLGANAVNSAKVTDNSLTGSDILESSLGTVPSATQASTADSATEATHAASADSATNAANADQLGGHGQADFGSGILGGAVTPSVASLGSTHFFPIGFTGTAGNSAGFVVPASATMRDISVSLSSAAPAGGALHIFFMNSTTGAYRECAIFSGDSTCDSFTTNGQFGFSPGDLMTAQVLNGTNSTYSGTVSFGYRLTN